MIVSPHEIAIALGGEVVSRDGVTAPGPGHSPKDRSLSVKISADAPNGLLVHSFAGDDWRLCRDHVLKALGIAPDIVVKPAPRLITPRSRDDRALQLWKEAGTARNTLAETYLAGRGLQISDWVEDVRFHSSCPFGSERLPCMIGLFRDIRTNEPKAIHRTALAASGEKIDRKTLGPKGGCAIKLDDDAEVSHGLTIAEGIETALAGAALGFRPVWAVGDAGEIARFPILSGIECLTILVDNDKSGTGQASALQCSERWTTAGREVFRVVPAIIGDDMADVARRKAAA